MTDLPDEIMVWRSMEKLTHIGTWATERYPAEAIAYIPRAEAEAAMAAVVERAESHAKSTNGVWQRNLELIADRDRLAAANAALEARVAGLMEAMAFDRADWFWRTMDPDDCGDSPEEAISRAMVGRFCVCEIASSFSGPTRYGFIAPVLDPESDDEEFIHFDTRQEAIDEAKRRAALASGKPGEAGNG